jgi:molybdate transport system ATP-binding protein
MAFQGQLLFPHLTALENVAFGPRTAGAARDAARRTAQDWLDRFGVGELAGRRPRQLSGGQAQRVSIARALATDPAGAAPRRAVLRLDVGVAASLGSSSPATSRRTTASRCWSPTTRSTPSPWPTSSGSSTTVGSCRWGRRARSRRLPDPARRPAGRAERAPEGDRFLSFSPSSVTVSPAEPAGSARHRWPGTVTSLAPHGDAVRVLVSGEHELLADVTPAAVAELELAPGREVWLSVKETAVRGYVAETETGES